MWCLYQPSLGPSTLLWVVTATVLPPICSPVTKQALSFTPFATYHTHYNFFGRPTGPLTWPLIAFIFWEFWTSLLILGFIIWCTSVWYFFYDIFHIWQTFSRVSMLSMWIPREHILVNILSGMPHLVGMILAVWIVSQVLSNLLLAM